MNGNVSSVSMSYMYVCFRYELRVRYLPRSFQDLYARDKVTFYYLYDQVGCTDKQSHLYVHVVQRQVKTSVVAIKTGQ